MNLNTSRFSGLSTLLANPAHLAALRKFSTDTTATAADYGLTAKDLSYLGSACECALIDLGDLLKPSPVCTWIGKAATGTPTLKPSPAP